MGYDDAGVGPGGAAGGVNTPGGMHHLNNHNHNQSLVGGMHHNGNGRKPAKEPKDDGKPNRPYVKKPLNAFMLYMKEMRSKVVAECTLKESAAINQILGRKVMMMMMM